MHVLRHRHGSTKTSNLAAELIQLAMLPEAITTTWLEDWWEEFGARNGRAKPPSGPSDKL